MLAPDYQSIRLMTWNINSMGPTEIQNKFLSRLKKSKDNMFFLVDTRLSEEQEDSIPRRWGQHCYFNSLASNARGVAVF